MNPDLGMHILAGGLKPQSIIQFRDVPIFHIGVISRDHLTTSLDYQWEYRKFAASFDFGPSVFRELTAKMESKVVQMLRDELLGKRRPYLLSFPSPVVAKMLECNLGALTQGAEEVFVPFHVHRIYLD